jgi:hypothetical protein
LELFNVYAEIEYQEVVKKLREELEKKMAEIGDEPEHI